ncbi:MAG: hypothetical protein KR126chlam2_01342 [Chlamydiae bacterium]|nr:hypothetical protein [Chlamydiota bacterium]
MNLSNLLHTTLIFWIVLDPFANIPFFAALLKHLDPKRQRKVIWREMLIALGVMFGFFFFGQQFFQLFNISQPSLQITGGVILFIIALQLVFSKTFAHKTDKIPKEPFIVPLAIPSVAGPAILATISLYGGGVDGNNLVIFTAIVLSWLLLLPLVMLASLLKQIFGHRGLIALERLFGYILVLIAVQMALNGFVSVFK